MIRLVVVAAASIGLILFVAFIAARLVQARTRGLSIRMQIFLALAAIVGAFAFGLGVMVIDRIEARAVRLATQAAEDEAAVIAGMIAGEVSRSRSTIQDAAGRFEQDRMRGGHLTVELLDARGNILFPAAGAPPPRIGTVSVEAPIVVDERTIGAVRVVKPTVVMQRLLTDFAPTVLVISLVLGAAAALAAAWIGRAIAAPIESLSRFSERVSHGDPARPPPLTFGREVARLRRSIDSMRRQLEGRPFVETFAADLSHELKNPVAAIRASAEVLEESALEDPEAARRFVSRIREATDRIERLLGELLSLARIEARGVEAFSRIDLSRVTSLAVESFEAERDRIDMTTERDAGVRGDATWLGRAVANLVDNALVFAEPDTRVGVRVERTDEGVIVTVDNAGAVPRHVCERAFSRFVTTRPDKGGSGLGLAIVRAVAEAHGGRVELADPGPPRVSFRLVLPGARHRSEAGSIAGKNPDFNEIQA